MNEFYLTSVGAPLVGARRIGFLYFFGQPQGLPLRNIVFTLLLTTLASCAYHAPMLMPVRGKNFYEYRKTIDQITLVCQSLAGSSASEMMLGADLPKAGILPLELILFNESAVPYDLSNMVVRVSDTQDRELKVVPARKVAKRVHRSTIGRTLAWGSAGTLFLFYTIPFAMAAGHDSFKANRATKRILIRGEERRPNLPASSIVRWFVYFDLPTAPETYPEKSAERTWLLEVGGLHPVGESGLQSFAIVFE